MLRSEIWLINLDPTVGSEIRKTCGEIEDIILLLADVFLDRLRGISQTQLAQRLPLKQPAVSNAVRRGARLVRQRQYSLEPKK